MSNSVTNKIWKMVYDTIRKFTLTTVNHLEIYINFRNSYLFKYLKQETNMLTLSDKIPTSCPRSLIFSAGKMTDKDVRHLKPVYETS